MATRHLLQDLIVVVASLVLAWLIIRYEWVHLVLAQLDGGVLLGSFIAGMFFTSVTTTAPAIVVLGELAQEGNLLLVALLGGLGAVVGDYVIFAFVRDRVSEDIAYVLRRTGSPRIFKVFRRKTFRRFLPFLGGLIIASPFPDELGLALLGLSRMRTSRFLLLAFTFNAAGILLIGLAARAVAP